MLPREARLSRSEVAEVVTRGQRQGQASFGLRWLVDRGANQSRFAIVVPAKQVPLAVSRHRLKRQLRALIQSFGVDLAPGYWVVIFCGKVATTWSTTQLRERVRQLFSQIKLLP